MVHIDTVTAKRLAERFKRLYGSSTSLSSEFFGSTPPSALVSCVSYPKLSLGILVSEEEVPDNPLMWNEREYSIEDLLELRLSLVNARAIVSSSFPRTGNGFYEKILESEMSTKSVDLEVRFKKIQRSPFISRFLPFYGLKGWIRGVRIADNPKIPRIVEKILDDGLKTEKAVQILYKKGFSDYYISRLFSLGVFGEPLNKKLVPSKWSITATHKILISKIEQEIAEYDTFNSCFLFEKKFYGNHFYVIVFPGSLSFELLEAILPGSAYNLCYNFTLFGKDDVSGGYYAAKLSFYEFLSRVRRSGSCIVIRVVTKEYKVPLGVWVVREGVKRAFDNVIGKYNSLSEVFEILQKKLERYNIPLRKLKNHSGVMRQRTLSFLH